MPLLRLRNPIRDYPWGSTSAIPDLLGRPGDGTPQAELWLGAHPDSPSTLPDGSRLDEVVAADPERQLGARVHARFGARLPFLLKVIAAASPLSLQVHPDPEQARAGFDDEQRRGVPRDSGRRRYRDPFHKPELVVALEPFEALCGLRDPARTRALLDQLDVTGQSWSHLCELLDRPQPEAALSGAVGWLLGGDPRVPPLVEAVATAAARHPDYPELVTTTELAAAYPGDPGVLVALLLNRVTLAPGEALFLPAGNLHAYLRGTALEVMAASDNVLRAGLTGKHVDVAELLRISDFTPHRLPVVRPEGDGPLTYYRPDIPDFTLARAELAGPQWYDVGLCGPRVLLVLSGTVEAQLPDDQLPARAERLARGESAYVASADGPLRLRGTGTAVVAGSPLAGSHD